MRCDLQQQLDQKHHNERCYERADKAKSEPKPFRQLQHIIQFTEKIAHFQGKISCCVIQLCPCCIVQIGAQCFSDTGDHGDQAEKGLFQKVLDRTRQTVKASRYFISQIQQKIQ